MYKKYERRFLSFIKRQKTGRPSHFFPETEAFFLTIIYIYQKHRERGVKRCTAEEGLLLPERNIIKCFLTEGEKLHQNLFTIHFYLLPNRQVS